MCFPAPKRAGGCWASSAKTCCGASTPTRSRRLLDPERFAPRNRDCSVFTPPFGGGTRSCIGANFAQIEARVLQRFDVSARTDSAVYPATIEPRPGVPMIVKRRSSSP
ncbi:MAG: cytochrome P450 [Chloroflexi bacterium]|nr:cytochrome P450 [Chloroflexota bacterium]